VLRGTGGKSRTVALDALSKHGSPSARRDEARSSARLEAWPTAPVKSRPEPHAPACGAGRH
jgi:hypothetical protein